MKNNTTNTSIGFVGLLTICFIVLKLCGIINWSWWWVLSPIWIEIVFVLIVLLVIFIIETVKIARGKRGDK